MTNFLEFFYCISNIIFKDILKESQLLGIAKTFSYWSFITKHLDEFITVQIHNILFNSISTSNDFESSFPICFVVYFRRLCPRMNIKKFHFWSRTVIVIGSLLSLNAILWTFIINIEMLLLITCTQTFHSKHRPCIWSIYDILDHQFILANYWT